MMQRCALKGPLKIFIVLVMLSWWIFGTSIAYATMPVVDYTAIIQLMRELKQMKDQYDMMTNQYNQLKTQYGAITGNYGWGDWKNSQSDLEKGHEWAASDWKNALKGMAGGNPDRYQQLLDQYKSNHTAMKQEQYEKGTDKNLSATYKNQVETNQASATTATYEFNDINKHLQALHDLGQQIEDANKNNNIKAAMDLNTRAQLEVGYISVEELRMQTLLNQQTAGAQSSKIALENEASQYNQAGEQK